MSYTPGIHRWDLVEDQLQVTVMSVELLDNHQTLTYALLSI
jgi:hypothetical protein